MKIPDRYESTGSSNSGGMGDIHHCRDTHLDRTVVLKMLKDGEETRRLLDEQKALTRVRSKHVVQLYDVILVEWPNAKKTALVLEHIDGADLELDTFEPGMLYLNTIWQVACGLSEIHKENIIHRDIKPGNIRVDANGVVKIIDFGLARSTGIEAKTLTIIGTPGYMAPELWKNSDVSFDQSIDVYAFGVTALVLVTSKNAPKELIARPPRPILKGALRQPLLGVPIDVIEIIEKCLSEKPSDRPLISEVEETIRRHLLKGKHRALLVLGATTYEINSSSPKVTVSSGTLNSLDITYDGLKFIITNLAGNVLINNVTLNVGEELPSCCVIAFGTGNSREFVTFDISNPEVMP